MRETLDKLIEEMLDKGILGDEALGEFERRFILKALERHRGNLTRAAKVLGCHRNTLSRKLDEYKIKRKAG